MGHLEHKKQWQIIHEHQRGPTKKTRNDEELMNIKGGWVGTMTMNSWTLKWVDQ
jgi:hypothetical protein